MRKMGRKRWGAGVLSVCMALSMSVSSVAIAAEGVAETMNYQDGTYEGSGDGFGGQITLSVTIKDGKITEIHEVSQKETKIYWEDAKTLFDEIIEKQSADVDSVSGATKSCDAVKTAVKQALNAASVVDNSKPDASIFESGVGTAENPFVVKTAKQFQAFAASVTGVVDYAGYTVRLDGDVDISGQDWEPIGGEDVHFNGTLDGNGHCIIGLTEGSKEAARTFDKKAVYVGLFGKLGAKAVIRDLKLTKVNMNVSCPNQIDIGAIAATTTGAGDGRVGTVIDGCAVDGSIIINNEQGNIWAGGLVGMQFRGAVINSSSDIDVHATETMGTKWGDTTEAYWVEVGGISGLNFWGVIANSFATGDIYGKYYNENTTDHSKEATYLAVGGIAGLECGDEVNNYVTGNITAGSPTNYIGSLQGLVEGSAVVSNCRYSQDIKLTNGSDIALADDNNICVVPEDDKESVRVENNTGFSTTGKSMLAEALNAGQKNITIDMTTYGVQTTDLKPWKYDADVDAVLQDTAVNQTSKTETVDIHKCNISGVTDQIYTGKDLTQKIKVTYDGKGVTYTVQYDDRKNIGTRHVTISGIGEFSGSVQVAYKILPNRTEVKTAKASGKNVKVAWQKVKGGNQYQIAIRKGSGKWKNYYASGTSKTLKKIRSPKKYKVRVRAYKSVGGKKYYGAWSKITKVK